VDIQHFHGFREVLRFENDNLMEIAIKHPASNMKSLQNMEQ
jgi:hypothetical protein